MQDCGDDSEGSSNEVLYSAEYVPGLADEHQENADDIAEDDEDRSPSSSNGVVAKALRADLFVLFFWRFFHLPLEVIFVHLI